MPASRRNIGAEILAAIRDLKAGRVGRVINVPPVSSIRERTGLSRTDFARRIGISVRTLRDWEQGRRCAPSGPRERSSRLLTRIQRRCSRSRVARRPRM